MHPHYSRARCSTDAAAPHRAAPRHATFVRCALTHTSLVRASVLHTPLLSSSLLRSPSASESPLVLPPSTSRFASPHDEEEVDGEPRRRGENEPRHLANFTRVCRSSVSSGATESAREIHSREVFSLQFARGTLQQTRKDISEARSLMFQVVSGRSHQVRLCKSIRPTSVVDPWSGEPETEGRGGRLVYAPSTRTRLLCERLFLVGRLNELFEFAAAAAFGTFHCP